MQDHVPLRSSYQEWGYDALATTTSLSDFEQTEAEERSLSIGWQPHPDNYRKMSLLALCCCCPVGVKASRQPLQVSMKLATYLSVHVPVYLCFQTSSKGRCFRFQTTSNLTRLLIPI